jgi:hypothetical protein
MMDCGREVTQDLETRQVSSVDNFWGLLKESRMI